LVLRNTENNRKNSIYFTKTMADPDVLHAVDSHHEDNNNNVPLVNRVQVQLDEFFNCLSREWVSPVWMNMHTGILAHEIGTPHKPTNIIAFISNKKRSLLSSDYAFFDRDTFPPPSLPYSKEDGTAAFHRLLHEIGTATREAGFDLVSNGRIGASRLSQRTNSMNTGPLLDAWEVECPRRSRYKQNFTPKPHTSYRSTSLHSDRRLNSRGKKGVKEARRATTTRPLCKEEQCPFFL
jgi:hypothetical protein